MKILHLPSAVVLALLCSAAHAQGPKCSFNITNISFGTIDVKNGRPYDATGTFSYSCTGDAREIIRICPSLGFPKTGSRYLTDPSGDKLFFNLYTDASRTTVWGTWYSKTDKAPSIDAPIGRSERTSGTVTIYARVNPDQKDVPPAVYNSSISGSSSAFAYDYASKGTCESIKSGDRVSVPVSVAARVGDGSPSSQPIVAPDATHTTDPGSAQVTDSPSTHEKRSFWQTMRDNAAYQQQKNQGYNPPYSSNNTAPNPL
jgi:spore coat protein U-like protein